MNTLGISWLRRTRLCVRPAKPFTSLQAMAMNLQGCYSRFSQKMRLLDAVEICRRCHELAPFCFYNGNTFVAIIRDVIGKLPLSSEQGYLIRSLAGHIVAGVADGSEQEAFGKFCTQFESGG